MASQKPLAANKANASRSTGPKTAAGKAQSRLNSFKHGLTAETLVIGGENPREFDELRQQLMLQHNPRRRWRRSWSSGLPASCGVFGGILFFGAAILAARQAQVREQDEVAYENSEEEEDQDNEIIDEEWLVHVGNALIHDGAWGDALGKLSRYEATLMNAFTRAMQMLHALQVSAAEKTVLQGAEAGPYVLS